MPEFVAYLAVALASLAFLLVSAVGLSLYLPAKASRRRERAGNEAPSARDRVDWVLADALALNKYSIGREHQPSVRLGDSTRFAPLLYQAGAAEIAQRLRAGSVVSLDLRRLTRADAARLVDFCSGFVSATTGCIFQVADGVLVLIPGSD